MNAILKRWHWLAEIFSDRRLVFMLALGFSSGLPFLLVLGTLSLRLAEAGVPVAEIGFLSYVGLAYSLKFLWAPVIDAYDPPLLARLLGRRRAWMLVAQLAVAAGLVGLALTQPDQGIAAVVAVAFLVAFASATQDVVVDGWRIDAAPTERQGMMSASYQLGYRIALLAAGAGALYVAQYFGWGSAYVVMALLVSVGIAACLLAPVHHGRDGGPETKIGWSLQHSFVEPLTDLTARKGVALIPILILVALYRMPDFLSGVMANPLYNHLGFSKIDIANVSKLYGFWISIAGAFAGGVAVTRVGLMPTLVLGGIAASASHLTLALLATRGNQLPFLVLAISVENFASGIAGTSLIAFMSSLTSPTFAATQYALLSSLYALPGKIVGGLSGLMVAAFGYPAFFMLTSTIGIPVVILSLIVWRHSAKAEAAEAEPATKVPAQ